MSSEEQNPGLDLSREEKELILKALSYYQVHLFDEMSKKKDRDSSLDPEYRNTTVVIKKVHKTIEKHA